MKKLNKSLLRTAHRVLDYAVRISSEEENLEPKDLEMVLILVLEMHGEIMNSCDQEANFHEAGHA